MIKRRRWRQYTDTFGQSTCDQYKSLADTQLPCQNQGYNLTILTSLVLPLRRQSEIVAVCGLLVLQQRDFEEKGIVACDYCPVLSPTGSPLPKQRRGGAPRPRGGNHGRRGTPAGHRWGHHLHRGTTSAGAPPPMPGHRHQCRGTATNAGAVPQCRGTATNAGAPPPMLGHRHQCRSGAPMPEH